MKAGVARLFVALCFFSGILRTVPLYAGHTNITVDSKEMSKDWLADKEPREKSWSGFSVSDSTSVGLNEDGDPHIKRQF